MCTNNDANSKRSSFPVLLVTIALVVGSESHVIAEVPSEPDADSLFGKWTLVESSLPSDFRHRYSFFADYSIEIGPSIVPSAGEVQLRIRTVGMTMLTVGNTVLGQRSSGGRPVSQSETFWGKLDEKEGAWYFEASSTEEPKHILVRLTPEPVGKGSARISAEILEGAARFNHWPEGKVLFARSNNTKR